MTVESPAFANQSGSYSAEQTRRAIFADYARTPANDPGVIVGGLLSGTDLQLSAPASGMSVNISTGEAIIPGTEGGAQGGYYARATSQTNLAVAAANPSNPRIDLVCATVSDSGYTEPSGGSGNQWALQVVTGTPTAGATLANLLGAPTLPGSSLLLGYVLVPAAASNIITADIANVATIAQAQAPALNLATPTQPSRVYGTAYQPNLIRPTLVVVIGTTSSASASGVNAKIGATNTPATSVANWAITQSGPGAFLPITFIVPTAWYYELAETNMSGNPVVTEQTL